MRCSLPNWLSWLAGARPPNIPVAITSRLTDRARAALKLAEQEARRLHHEYCGTEHLLFGLACDERGIAAAMMQELTGDLDSIREELNKLMIPGRESMRPRALQITPRLRKALDSAANEANALKHNYVGSEHLLLGLLSDAEGVPVVVFHATGMDPVSLRQKLLAIISANSTA